MTESKINPDNIRSKEQYEATKKAMEVGCAWCQKEKDQKSPLLKKLNFTFWQVRKNAFPKSGRDMYLIILQRHAPLNEITPTESAEYFLVRQWLIEKLGLRGGCFIHRFGDPELHASSLPTDPTDHYFENVVVPHGDAPVSETLVKDKSPENKTRLEEHAKSFTDPD